MTKVKEERFRHPLFDLPGLHVDDAPGMPGYRQAKSQDGAGAMLPAGVRNTTLRPSIPRILRRPVTVLDVTYDCVKTCMANIAVRVGLWEIVKNRIDNTFWSGPTNAWAADLRWVDQIAVRDEESGETLLFHRCVHKAPPIPLATMGDPAAWLDSVAIYDLGGGSSAHRWTLKLGRFRDDRIEEPEDALRETLLAATLGE